MGPKIQGLRSDLTDDVNFHLSKSLKIFFFIKDHNLVFSALQHADDLERKVLDDEEILAPCPEEGFHTDEKEEMANYNEDEKPKIVPENVKFLRETIRHCRHFISMVANPQWQLLSMEIVSEAMLRIQLEQ